MSDQSNINSVSKLWISALMSGIFLEESKKDPVDATSISME